MSDQRSAPAGFSRGNWIALRRGWWIGVIALATTLVAADRFTKAQTPVYRSNIKVVVGPDPGIVETQEILRTLESLERRTILATFTELSQSPEIRERAAGLLDRPVDELRAFGVSAGIVPNTNVIRLVAEGPTATGVAGFAEAVGTALGEEVQRLYAPFSIRALTRATRPMRPTSPDPRRNMVVAGVVGVFLGLGLALALGRVMPVRTAAPVIEPARAHATN